MKKKKVSKKWRSPEAVVLRGESKREKKKGKKGLSPASILTPALTSTRTQSSSP